MTSLIFLTIIFSIGITLLSFITKDIGKRILFPIAFLFISIILFFLSPGIGGWDGMGVGAVSVSLFVASAVAIPVIAVSYILGYDRTKNHS